MDKKVILQRLGIFLAYPLAYAYVVIISEGFGGNYWFSLWYSLLALGFISVNEIVRRGRRGALILPPKSTIFWYAMTLLCGLTATFGPDETLSIFAMHLCAVYSVLVSNDILLGGKTSGFIPADLIHGFYVKSFAGFPNFIVDWKCFGRNKQVSDGLNESKHGKNVFGAVFFVIIMSILLIISVSLMSSIDEDLAWFLNDFFNNIFDCFENLDVATLIVRAFFAVPVCFYVYGLISRSAKSDGQREKRVASWLNRVRGKGKTTSSVIVYIAAGIFVVFYLLFFIKRLTYMLGGFVGNVPEGTLVSQYAREGFFELVGIMAVNMFVYLAIILFGKTDSDGKFALPAKILVTMLMAESIIFAAVALSKLGLYYSIYGYTPKRILAMWGALALGFASTMTILTVNRGKPHIRAGIVFTAASYVAICVLSGVLAAIGA